MRDVLDELCDLLKESKIRFVFWTCPRGCDGRVKWNEKKTDATCQVCGAKKSDNIPYPDDL